MKAKVKDPNRIRFGEYISYFITNMGNIPLMLLLSSFFLIFYTDVVGLDPEKIATLFLISKVMDGISDPIMGFLLDRFPRTKMGKFRPMLIFGVIVCCINYILMWFGAVWAPVGKYVIVYITYLLLGWTFDIMDISLNGMLPVMTDDEKERGKLSLVKMLGYTIGGMVVSIGGPIIVANGTLQEYYILIFGAVAVVLIFSVGGILGVKERVKFEATEEAKYSLKELFSFFRLRPVLTLFLSCIIMTVGMNISGANTYYYTYVMGDLTLMAAVTGISSGVMMPAMLLAPIIANKIGKKRLFVFGLGLAGVGTLIRIFAPTSLTMAYIGSAVMGIGTGMSTPLMYMIQADNTSYVEYKTGKHTEAAIASLSSFITKVGQGVAGALPGYVLAWTGFVANAQTQEPAVISGIIACVITIPGILLIAAAVLFGFGYNLSKKDLAEISVALKEKHEKMEA